MYINLLIGMIVGIFYCYFIFPKKEGGEINYLNKSFGPIKNGKLYINGYHIHHWLFYFVIAIIISLYITLFNTSDIIKKNLYYLLGFSSIMIINGLQYDDAFNFV